VAGNHDVRVLPRLADELPELRLLGRDGCWESALLTRQGQPRLRVLGWSFPERVVRRSPLDAWPQPWRAGRFEDGAPDSLPTLGLLHADLDASGSAYAPVSRAALRRHPLAAWLIGHVHAPDRDALAAECPLGYLGSLSPLDPGEHGPRGPWLARLEGARLRLEQVPLAPLRYERVPLELDEVDSAERLQSKLLAGVREAHARLAPGLGRAEVVALRFLLRGARRIQAAALEPVLRRAIAREGEAGLREKQAEVHYFVEEIDDHSRPARDLDQLAQGSDPVGLLARRLLALEAKDPEGLELCRRAGRELESSRLLGGSALLTVRRDGHDPHELRERLLRLGRRALEELLAQRDPAASEPARERDA
jgi:exonuclease SbcD